MKTALRFLPLFLIATMAFVVACGDDDVAPTPTVNVTGTAEAVATAAAAAAAQPAAAPPAAVAPPPAPVAAPVAATGAPKPKNPVGTIIAGFANLDCSPTVGTVFCDQYQADAWGVGEDLFTWRWRDDGTIDYSAGQLAAGWVLAPDSLSVVVETRQGVQFHKGAGELTAEDVAWSYNQVNPSITTHSIAPSASYFSTLFGRNQAVATDANHVEFKFASLDTHWNTYMMNTNGFVGVVIHSKKAFDAAGGEEGQRDTFISTGPYEVESWTRDDRAVFAKTGNHWALDPKVDRVIIQSMPEDATRIAAMQTGELDVVQVGIKNIPQLLDDGFLTASAGNASQAGIIFSGNNWEAKNALTGEDLGTASSGVYARDIEWIGNPFRPDDGNNPESLKCPSGADPLQISQSCGDMEQARLVRQAVAMAIDKEAINKALLAGKGWPVHIGYADEKSEFWDTKWEFPFDVAMANDFLDQAGYPRGGDGTRFEMPLFTNTGQYAGLGEEIADAVSGMMGDIGIKTAVLKFPYAVFRPGLVGRSTTIPRITAGDDGQTIFPFDWPKGIEESSLSRGGYCMCYEAEWISETYLAVGAEPDFDKRVALNRKYFDNQRFWALKPGVIAIPALTTYNPNSIEEWVMEPSFMTTTAFWNIVPATR